MENDDFEYTYPVLEKGHVRLLRHAGSDNSIIRSAGGIPQKPGEDEGKDRAFIESLLKMRYTKPFAGVRFSFEIKAPIFVYQYWNQYREWAFAEVSGCYSKIHHSFYIPETSVLMTQGTVSKVEAARIRLLLIDQHGRTLARYHQLVGQGCPQVYCDSILPISAYADMHIEYDLNSLFNFLRLRLNKETPFEVKVYAEAMLLLIEGVAPLTVAAFRKQILGTANPLA